ncbi:MAG: hypothetical protein SH817_13315 [Leptospira sp.]|nr:hypothetical protein [Leptospira sp.]
MNLLKVSIHSKNIAKRILFISIILALNFCYSLSIISPGISSIYKLRKIGDIRFEEAKFYGSAEYSYQLFFIEDSFLQEIFDDPNNLYFDENQNFGKEKISNQVNSKRFFLFELCYSKDREFDILTDIKDYDFRLNQNPSLYQIHYSYAYSYYQRGEYKFKNKPLIVRDKLPHSKLLLTTGTDFISCVRSILVYDQKNEIKGKNSFKVITSNKNHLDFYYNYIHEFEKYWDEPMEIRVK